MLNKTARRPKLLMFIKSKPVFLLAIAGLVLGGAGVVWAAEQLDAGTKARVEKFEKGPATVNVSKYPSSIQAGYQVFAQKCAQCHKLSRPINSDFVLPGEWSRYIKRMMYKPGSGINGGDAKSIYAFLVYDSNARKKSQLDAKLKSLPAAESAEEQKKVKEVVDAAK